MPGVSGAAVDPAPKTKVVSFEDARGPSEDLATTKSTKNSIRLVPFDQIKLGTKRRYLVDDLIPKQDLVLVWGNPKSGKTFWVLDVALHIALGWQYQGKRVEQGPVVYCAFEGQFGFDKRVAAFKQHHLQGHEGDVPFYLVGLRLNLVKQHRDLIRSVGEQIGEAKPVLLVLDTLNRSFQGSESSDEDMTAYVAAAGAISDAFDCTVLIVHHCGVAGDRPRGHSSLTGTIGAQLKVMKTKNGTIKVEVECAKDGPEGVFAHGRLEPIEVGKDEDGIPIISCVVVPTEGEGFTTEPSISGATARALEILKHAIGERGSNLATGERAVEVSVWRKLCEDGRLSASPHRKSRQKAFDRAKDTLQEEGIINIDGMQVWIVDQTRSIPDDIGETGDTP